MTSVTRHLLLSLACACALLSLHACGGGGSSSSDGTATTQSAALPSASSGTISAFGSVFVDGREFGTGSAHVIDDDTLASTSSTTDLEVGMAVDVRPLSGSTASSPQAAEIHVHPLARGIVDASDASANTLTVMGQTVQVTASTTYTDHRACLTAASSPCTAIIGQSGLTATTGSGGAAVAGSFVTVDGYLYDSGSAGDVNIVATLVSVRDLPGGTHGANYKAEGVVTALTGTTATIGGLSVDLSTATCFAADAQASCASAFSVGQVVSAFSAAEPTLPVTAFAPTTALLRDRLVVETAGASVELEGVVSGVTTSPAAFVIRGVTIDASALPAGTALPAVGDVVRVQGTVATGGASVVASALTVLHTARSATYGFEGNDDGVTAGSTADTYVLTILGQSIAVNASTRLADLTVRGGNRGDSTAHPFNITTFQSYLSTSVSQHLLVRSAADASGNLSALSVVIVPASTVAGVTGVVDATPVPVNSSATGTPSTFSIHGVAVSADPSAIVGIGHRASGAGTTIAAGDDVLALGTYAAPTLTVAAVSGTLLSRVNNVVIDSGVPPSGDHDGF